MAGRTSFSTSYPYRMESERFNLDAGEELAMSPPKGSRVRNGSARVEPLSVRPRRSCRKQVVLTRCA